MKRLLVALSFFIVTARAFAGPGIGITTNSTLTGTGASTNALGVNSATVQLRVSSSCAVGSWIRAVAANGTVTCDTLIPGLGIVLSGDNLSADATYLQRRVSTSCGVGSAIGAIAADGSVTCVTAGVSGTGTTGNLTAWSGSTAVGNYAGSAPSACAAGQSLVQVTEATTGTLSLTCATNVSSVVAGTGISVSTTSGAATVTANLAGATCSVGQAVTAVSSTGVVTCSSVGSNLTVSVTNDEAGSLPIGTVVYPDANSGVKKAIATSLTTVNAIGLVADVSIASSAAGNISTGGTVVATTAQWDAVAGTTGGLAFGSRYYVDPTTAGKITATAPSTTGQYVEEVGIAISTTTMIVRPRTPIGL